MLDETAVTDAPPTAPPSSLPPWLDRLWRFEYRNEVVICVGILILIQVFPKTIPEGIYGLGLVSGAALALQAIGVVLVYRSNRIINFAQVQIGATAAAIFFILAHYLSLPRIVNSLCPVCLERDTTRVYEVNYWLSMALAMALSILIAWLVYVLVVRRFANAPRLVLTVATIFLAQGLPFVSGLAGNLLTTKAQRVDGQVASSGPAPLPFDFTIKIGHPVPVIFHAVDVFTVVAAVAATIALFFYLRLSATGTAIRASAENPARAATLGVNVSKVTSRVWLIVGILSGLGALLATIQSGGSGGLGPTTLVEILAVAVVARFTNLPMTLIAAVVLGVLQQAVLWAYNTSTPLDAGLIVLIAIVLLAQRYRVSRAELEQSSAWQATREVRPIPEELRVLPSVRKWLIVLAATGAVIVLGYPWVMSPSQTELGALVMIYAMAGLSLLILTGWAGQISLGQFGFSAVGAYVAAVVHLPFLLAVPIGALAGAAVAFVVGIPALKLRGLHLAVITLAFALAVSSYLLDPSYLGKHLPSELNRPTLLGISFNDQRAFFYLTVVVLIVVVVGVVGLRRSRTGRVLIAARDNERATQSFGVSLTRVRLTAFAISGFIAALAGGLFAYQQHGVVAASFAPGESLNIFLYSVIGGLGSVSGPIVGAVYAGALQIFGASPLVAELATGLGGLCLVLLIPGGLTSLIFSIRDAALRRIASRNRMVVASLISDRDPSRVASGAAISPKVAKRGGTTFIPTRYALDRQWALRIADAVVAPGTTARAPVVAGTRSSAGAFEGLADEDGAGHG